MRSVFAVLLVLAMGCGESEEEVVENPCEEEDAVQCDGDVLQECIDGQWTVAEDCAESGQMCHEEMGHCMDMMTGTM